MNNSQTPHNVQPKLNGSHFHIKYLFTWIGLILLFFASQLPFYITHTFGKFLGLFLYYIASRRRQIAEINLKHCFPKKEEKEIQLLTKNHFINFGIGLFEMGVAWWAPDKRIKKIKTSLKNDELFEDIKNNKSGTLVLIKHSTHIELDLRLLSQKLDLGGMYRPQNNLVVNYFMIRARNSFFKGVIKKSEAKLAIKWLKSGINFLYAADQDYGKKVSEFIDFFGHKAATVTFPAFLAKQGIRTIFINVDRNKYNYEIKVIELDRYIESTKFLSNMNYEYEKAIKSFPEQYLWVHRRFKSYEEEEENIYSNIK